MGNPATARWPSTGAHGRRGRARGAGSEGAARSAKRGSARRQKRRSPTLQWRESGGPGQHRRPALSARQGAAPSQMRPLRVRKTHLSAYKGGNSAWNEGGRARGVHTEGCASAGSMGGYRGVVRVVGSVLARAARCAGHAKTPLTGRETVEAEVGRGARRARTCSAPGSARPDWLHRAVGGQHQQGVEPGRGLAAPREPRRIFSRGLQFPCGSFHHRRVRSVS